MGFCDDGDKTGGGDDGEPGSEDGGNIRGVQFSGCCKHVVDVCGDGDKTGGGDDGVAGVEDGDDIREVQLGGGCKHEEIWETSTEYYHLFHV